MSLRLRAAAALSLVAACRNGAPPPPAAPAEFGVHVANAANDTVRTHFTVTVKGSLELGIRSLIVAVQPDRSLLLATPADLVVNKGDGSAVIAAADSGARLTVTPLLPADSAQATAQGAAVLLTRAPDVRHVTAKAVTPPTPKSRAVR